jgi:hypothetical protein
MWLFSAAGVEAGPLTWITQHGVGLPNVIEGCASRRGGQHGPVYSEAVELVRVEAPDEA